MCIVLMIYVSKDTTQLHPPLPILSQSRVDMPSTVASTQSHASLVFLKRTPRCDRFRMSNGGSLNTHVFPGRVNIHDATCDRHITVQTRKSFPAHLYPYRIEDHVWCRGLPGLYLDGVRSDSVMRYSWAGFVRALYGMQCSTGRCHIPVRLSVTGRAAIQ